MTGSMFLSLDSAGMASCIGGAQVSVCYAAPGIQQEPAEALARLAKHLESLWRQTLRTVVTALGNGRDRLPDNSKATFF